MMKIWVRAGDLHPSLWPQEMEDWRVKCIRLTLCVFCTLLQVICACRWRSDKSVLQPSDQNCSSTAGRWTDPEVPLG